MRPGVSNSRPVNHTPSLDVDKWTRQPLFFTVLGLILCVGAEQGRLVIALHVTGSLPPLLLASLLASLLTSPPRLPLPLSPSLLLCLYLFLSDSRLKDMQMHSESGGSVRKYSATPNIKDRRCMRLDRTTSVLGKRSRWNSV